MRTIYCPNSKICFERYFLVLRSAIRVTTCVKHVTKSVVYMFRYNCHLKQKGVRLEISVYLDCISKLMYKYTHLQVMTHFTHGEVTIYCTRKCSSQMNTDDSSRHVQSEMILMSSRLYTGFYTTRHCHFI